ncbi:hypothetical protein BQ8794_180048 [Mesorhizobium prunaredense]|uniref:Uncharacterized protein n=1 Tax=Mesorhizobium prunaredense TaxID=1631249 RepID=A0A1R3V468_9HYPH|nr:hypothetical protein BQ8794_180048 [Mesorhizobium prunaredense]
MAANGLECALWVQASVDAERHRYCPIRDNVEYATYRKLTHRVFLNALCLGTLHAGYSAKRAD